MNMNFEEQLMAHNFDMYGEVVVPALNYVPCKEGTWENGEIAPPFLTLELALDGQLHGLTAVALERTLCTHCIGSWVCLRAGVGTVEREKFLATARNQILIA
jgi:hypothetical protein